MYFTSGVIDGNSTRLLLDETHFNFFIRITIPPHASWVQMLQLMLHYIPTCKLHQLTIPKSPLFTVNIKPLHVQEAKITLYPS